MERDKPYLQHILDAIATIEEYAQGIDFDTFLKKKLLQDGFVRQLEIIGEAAKNLSKELKEKHSHIPWLGITGMRDRLIHEYFGVDLKAVWQTAEEDIPQLKEYYGHNRLARRIIF